MKYLTYWKYVYIYHCVLYCYCYYHTKKRQQKKIILKEREETSLGNFFFKTRESLDKKIETHVTCPETSVSRIMSPRNWRFASTNIAQRVAYSLLTSCAYRFVYSAILYSTKWYIGRSLILSIYSSYWIKYHNLTWNVDCLEWRPALGNKKIKDDNFY